MTCVQRLLHLALDTTNCSTFPFYFHYNNNRCIHPQVLLQTMKLEYYATFVSGNYTWMTKKMEIFILLKCKIFMRKLSTKTLKLITRWGLLFRMNLLYNRRDETHDRHVIKCHNPRAFCGSLKLKHLIFACVLHA